MASALRGLRSRGDKEAKVPDPSSPEKRRPTERQRSSGARGAGHDPRSRGVAPPRGEPSLPDYA
eukprot:5582721-Alexandrium_andersonii.AAC.1